MTEDPNVLLPLLDALGNLSLPAETSRAVLIQVLSLLEAAKFEDLPAILRYLFQVCTTSNATSILNAIIANIKVTASGSKKSANHSLLCLDAIHSGVKYHPIVASRVLSDLKMGNVRFYSTRFILRSRLKFPCFTQNTLSNLEIWLLLFVACSTSLAASAKSAMLKKIDADHLTAERLSEAIGLVPGALHRCISPPSLSFNSCSFVL